MAKLAQRPVRFPDTPGSTGHKLYYAPNTDVLDYNSPFVTLPSAVDGYVHFDLSAVLPLIEGVYDLGLVAYDALGNESDMEVKTAVPLDSVPPVKPAPLEFL